MACSCNKGKTSFQVKLPNGQVAFTSTSKTAAEGVAKRYPGAKVEPKPPATQTTTPAKTPKP